jgi:DNA adenine methylase
MKLRNSAAHLMEPIKKPFLKWAGAKTQLVRKLRQHFPSGEYRFIEPFVGSGAVFLNSPYSKSLLSDSNQDIITLFSVLQKRSTPFIARCGELFAAENNAEAVYYDLREEFNSCHDEERRAALFVYLNRHCFNGLCRYNQKGKFNVPFGRYTRVYFPAAEMQQFASRLETAELRMTDFRSVLKKTKKGDVVYCDPPYVPLTKTANFTSYASGGFSQKDQEDLTALAVAAAERGAVVVVSNHDTPYTRSMYQQGHAQLFHELVSRTISCDGSNRTKAKEIIAVFGNPRPHELSLTT